MIEMELKARRPRMAIMPRRLGHIASPGNSPDDLGLALVVSFYNEWVPVRWLGQPGWATALGHPGSDLTLDDSTLLDISRFIETAKNMADAEGFQRLDVTLPGRETEVFSWKSIGHKPKVAILIGKPAGDQMSYPVGAFLQLEEHWVPIRWMGPPWAAINLNTIAISILKNFISLIETLAPYEGYSYVELSPDDFPYLIPPKQFK